MSRGKQIRHFGERLTRTVVKTRSTRQNAAGEIQVSFYSGFSTTIYLFLSGKS